MEAGAPLAAAGGAQTSLRGLLERSPNIVPIPGTTRRAHLEENMAAWRSLVR
jgi:aryl-alcohol dehydrogenase-like predicted oxidoreductase